MKKKAPWNNSGIKEVYFLENQSFVERLIGVWDHFDKNELIVLIYEFIINLFHS